MASGTFVTAINCIDGRVQRPVTDWLKIAGHADYVDMVTEPGPEKALTSGDAVLEQAIRAKVEISVNAHGSRVVACAAHFDCAGNPVSDAEHARQVRASVDVIAHWGLAVRVIGLWVTENGYIEVLADTGEVRA